MLNPCIYYIVMIILCFVCAVQSQSISISKNQDLQFGAMIKPGSSSTVTMSTSGNRTTTGGILLLPSSYGAFNAASYSVSALNVRWHFIYIQLPSSMTITGGGGSMVVNTFTSNPTGPIFVTTKNYNFTLYVGAKLNVGANQLVGSYTGTFNVTVTIQ